jgi:uncharacterized protein YlaI
MILDCIYCQRVSLNTKHWQTYVCDDCYDRNQTEKKRLLEAEARSYDLDE